ncbi:hypothetical protein ACQPZA_31050 [Pseudonocardia xinjiangensis]|uniref:hypothetical protein n=1 Tax=Pseudonocardia xinjiangensis TaxID=75289 RepID=UPI003D8B363B
MSAGGPGEQRPPGGAAEHRGVQEKAAREYKEVLSGITEAIDAMRERDRARAAELARELVRFDENFQLAAERAAVSRFIVELHWEAALEALWVESWLQLRPKPAPDLSVDAADFAALDAEVGRRAADLQEAVRRRRFGFPRR